MAVYNVCGQLAVVQHMQTFFPLATRNFYFHPLWTQMWLKCVLKVSRRRPGLCTKDTPGVSRGARSGGIRVWREKSLCEAPTTSGKVARSLIRVWTQPESRGSIPLTQRTER